MFYRTETSCGIGDIAKSRFWLSFERRPWRWSFAVHFGRTYNGTLAGLVVVLPCLTIIGHIRHV